MTKTIKIVTVRVRKGKNARTSAIRTVKQRHPGWRVEGAQQPTTGMVTYKVILSKRTRT